MRQDEHFCYSSKLQNFSGKSGAGDGIRTHDPNLGKTGINQSFQAVSYITRNLHVMVPKGLTQPCVLIAFYQNSESLSLSSYSQKPHHERPPISQGFFP